MSNETWDTQLYCQLQEGLRFELMMGPAVSGATKYQEPCVAEENRLAELRRRHQLCKSAHPRQSYFEYAKDTTIDPSGHLAASNKPNNTAGQGSPSMLVLPELLLPNK